MNSIIFSNDTGFSKIFKENIISLDGFIIDRKNLKNITITKNIPVYYKNSKIGKIKNCYYTDKDFSLNVIFSFSDVPADEQCFLMAVPRLDAKNVVCPQCDNSFNVGETPCNCILESTGIALKNVRIIGLDIFDVRETNNFEENKATMLRKFFGGAMAEIFFGNLENFEEFGL